MFRISNIPLEEATLREGLSAPEAGAVTIFEGRVRNHNHGKAVLALEYEAYEQLCVQEAHRILAEAKEHFDIIDAHCVHRAGKLNIGGIAVWVGVSSVHRDAGFKACRYIIDEVKSRLPIWKKEYYVNGDSGWVNCQECCRTNKAANFI